MSALLHIIRQHRADHEALAGGQAAAEAQRRSIRRSLVDWCRYTGHEPAAHHRLLIDWLEKLARSETQRLAIFMPPGSAKSRYGSVLFPPWLMASAPQLDVLAASHTTQLAAKWGRWVRNLIADHAPVLGISLAADSTAAFRWALNQGGEYYAVGVGVGIAGFRADLAIIDDPIRSREDADFPSGARSVCGIGTNPTSRRA